MTEEEEKYDPKDKKELIVHNLGGEEELSPSSLVRRPKCLL
jgi:hypothetical protein